MLQSSLMLTIRPTTLFGLLDRSPGAARGVEFGIGAVVEDEEAKNLSVLIEAEFEH